MYYQNDNPKRKLNFEMIKIKLADAFTDRPIEFIAAAGLVIGASAKLVDAVGSVRSKNAYARKMGR